MYNVRPGLLIGFHGCDKSRQQRLLLNPSIIPVSKEPFDWLGHGMYFWENNYDRAFQWAKEKEVKGKIEEAAVIGAVIDLSYCCDLIDFEFIKMVATSYNIMKSEHDAIGKTIPVNKDLGSDQFGDKLMRFLDCATIEFMHDEIRKTVRSDISTYGYTKYRQFDSIRGLFQEGGPAYDGAGFRSKSHIQICIRNPNCIKGFFLKREEIDFIAMDMLKKAV
jgi:hypothetical protein